MDMSPAHIKGARESFPDAEITFDRFHVVKLLNDAVEKVRRTEQKERPLSGMAGWCGQPARGVHLPGFLAARG